MLNRKSQFSDPELFKSQPRVDYFDNVCDYEARPPKPQNDSSKPQNDSSKPRPVFRAEPADDSAAADLHKDTDKDQKRK